MLSRVEPDIPAGSQLTPVGGSSVKNFSALISRRTSHDGKTFDCDNCVRPYCSQEACDRHLDCCLLNQPVTVKLPVEPSNPDVKAKAILTFTA